MMCINTEEVNSFLIYLAKTQNSKVQLRIKANFSSRLVAFKYKNVQKMIILS